MKTKLLRLLVGLLGALCGFGVFSLISYSGPITAIMEQSALFSAIFALVMLLVTLVCGIIAYVFSQRIIDRATELYKKNYARVERMHANDVFFGALGLLLGLAIAYFISRLFDHLPALLYTALAALLYVGCGVFMTTIARRRWHELPFLARWDKGAAQDVAGDASGTQILLDTSVLIDGRICDIAGAGFITAPLLIPAFILTELQKVADSSDEHKRRRGRRGLEMAQKLREVPGVQCHLGGYEDDSGDDADMKLLRLAKEQNFRIMTNDYNLNRVAALSGVCVMNINELANALKPALMAGDLLTIAILKEGKEHHQGVGYLDDGTMVVIENAKNRVGETLPVEVTSILQTAAGRMIFARISE